MEKSNLNIEALKKEHGELFQINTTFRDTKEKISCIVKAPTLEDLDMYNALSAQGKPASGMQILFANLYVAGDKRVLEDERTFRNVMPKAEKILATQDSEIKKL